MFKILWIILKSCDAVSSEQILECWAFLRMRPSRGTKWKDRASRLDDAVLTLLVTWFWVYWLLDASTRSSANRTVEDGVERLPSSWEKYNVVIIMCLCGVGHPLTIWAGFSNFAGGVRTSKDGINVRTVWLISTIWLCLFRSIIMRFSFCSLQCSLSFIEAKHNEKTKEPTAREFQKHRKPPWNTLPFSFSAFFPAQTPCPAKRLQDLQTQLWRRWRTVWTC